MKIRDIWVMEADHNHKAEFRASKTLTSREFKRACKNGSIKNLTIDILKHVINEVQEYIDCIEKNGFGV